MTAPQIQQINLGNYANDGTGDDLRTAFAKVNSNFNTLFNEGAIINGVNLGTGTGIVADKNTDTLNLEFKSLTSTGSSVAITHTDTTINLESNGIHNVESDLHPTLGGELNMNGFVIGGTGSSDLQSTIWGYEFRILAGMVENLIASGSNLDFGSFTAPPLTTVDMGTWIFGGPAPRNQVDFGAFV